MKNNKIRSKIVKESLLDYNNLANTLKENTTAAVKDLLSEAVRDTYSKILAEEDEDKDYDVEEVDDTDSEKDLDSDVEANDDANAEDSDDVDTEEKEDSVADTDDDSNVEVDINDDSDEDGDTEEVSIDGESEDGDEWSEFDKYKVSDDEYDFSNAEDDEIVKVYKLLNNDDQVIVNKDADNKVNIKDNETGAEYLVDLDNDGVSDDIDDDMNESRIFEIALDEYDSNVGYTDNYQNKDVLDSKGLSVADDKDKNDWGSKGLKTRDGGKRWSGKKNDASENQPFVDKDEAPVEEGASMGGRRGAIGSGRSTGTKQHTPDVSGNKNPYGQHHVSVAGKYKENGESTVDNSEATKVESVMRKANNIFAENKELKSALSKFKHVLEEAAVTNVNLGQIIKLISENTTSQDEKKEIIARFGKEAKTVEQSKNLYESISRDLQKKNKMNIDEGKQYGVEGSKQINETQIYQSKDLLDSLDLMHRLCK